MAYKNTPLTGLSVKQIQILIEARNRPGVHTYYPGGHSVLVSRYNSIMQQQLKGVTMTIHFERTNTVIPAQIYIRRYTERYGITIQTMYSLTISSFLNIYFMFSRVRKVHEKNVQQTFSHTIIFQVVATYELLKFFFDGEEAISHDIANNDLYCELRSLDGNWENGNPLLFHEYHFQPSIYRLDASDLILQREEYFVVGSILFIDVPNAYGDPYYVVIDDEEVLDQTVHIKYNFTFLSMGLLAENLSTRKKSFVKMVTPVHSSRIKMSEEYFARDITATLVTL